VLPKPENETPAHNGTVSDPGAELAAESVLECQQVRIDRYRHRAFANGAELHLTPTEFRLLECFVSQPGRIFSRRELVEAAIRTKGATLERSMDQHVRWLRRKLGSPGMIKTVCGVGFRFLAGGDERSQDLISSSRCRSVKDGRES